MSIVIKHTTETGDFTPLGGMPIEVHNFQIGPRAFFSYGRVLQSGRAIIVTKSIRHDGEPVFLGFADLQDLCDLRDCIDQCITHWIQENGTAGN